MSHNRTPGRWTRAEIPEQWVEVSSAVAARMRSVNLEDIALRKDQEGLFWAPRWARVICEIDGLGERARSAALRRAADDDKAGSALSTLFTAIDDKDERLDLIKGLVDETAQTICCPCGRKFDSAVYWLEHQQIDCTAVVPQPTITPPPRKVPTDTLDDDDNDQ